MEVVYHVQNGNLLDITEGLICHQVNCLGIMGAGLAKQIRERYPDVYQQYYNLCREGGYTLLGSIQVIKINDLLYAVNVFGQEKIGTDSRKTNYEAIDRAFSQLKQYVERHNLDSNKVYIPEKMGCTLGGGNWNVYLSIIAQYFPSVNIVKYK